ncbi:MAG: hypothetical protein MJK10_04330 [Pseudomonadales bacterium]|nr:hypothetical protein [Pseudomonadales bacterium]NRA15337.1 hypothetical protein [Oceanospirillaceae bacterium]
MTIKNNILLKIFSTLLFSMTATYSTSATVSECKGEPQSSCLQRASCSWIDTHKRKNGAVIKAYCRSKAKGRITSKKSLPTTGGSADVSTSNLSEKNSN